MFKIDLSIWLDDGDHDFWSNPKSFVHLLYKNSESDPRLFAIEVYYVAETPISEIPLHFAGFFMAVNIK